MSGAYVGHEPHNDNGTTTCISDGEPWPCVSSAERLATGPQVDDRTGAPRRTKAQAIEAAKARTAKGTKA